MLAHLPKQIAVAWRTALNLTNVWGKADQRSQMYLMRVATFNASTCRVMLHIITQFDTAQVGSLTMLNGLNKTEDCGQDRLK